MGGSTTGTSGKGTSGKGTSGKGAVLAAIADGHRRQGVPSPTTGKGLDDLKNEDFEGLQNQLADLKNELAATKKDLNDLKEEVAALKETSRAHRR